MRPTSASNHNDTSIRDAGRLHAFLRATRLLSVAVVAVSAVVVVAPHHRADRAEAATTVQAPNPAVTPTTAAETPAPAAATPEIVDGAGLVAAINEARTAKGLALLQSDPVLDAGAQQWAESLAAQGSVSHDPQLTAAYSDDWKRMAENVSTGTSIAELHAAALRTAASTLLDPNATLIGVGIIVQPDGVYLVERTVS